MIDIANDPGEFELCSDDNDVDYRSAQQESGAGGAVASEDGRGGAFVWLSWLFCCHGSLETIGNAPIDSQLTCH